MIKESRHSINALNRKRFNLFRQQLGFRSQSSCMSTVELTDRGGGVGGVVEEPNHTTARKPGPL